MIFLEMAQGSPEWLQARAGRCTASRFVDAVSIVGGLNEQQQTFVKAVLGGTAEKIAAESAGYKAVPRSEIITRALNGENTIDFSQEAKRYAADIAIEIISGKPHGEPPKAWVLDRGHEMERLARIEYEALTGAYVTESGLCIDDHGYAYSSDGLVEDDGLIEIKAPIDSDKIMAMLSVGDVSEYAHQMAGGLWITGRKWIDFIQYVPDLESVGKHLFIKRVYRDEDFIASMVEGLSRFMARVDANVQLLRA